MTSTESIGVAERGTVIGPESVGLAERGTVIAPAGHGKTHLISQAVAGWGGSRELILTHTHAGVEALRKHMRREGVPSQRYEIETIAGWSLRLATAYPRLSKIASLIPRTVEEWHSVYGSTIRVLQSTVLRDVIAHSYSGIYIDEYQDCTVEQHQLTRALASITPMRLLGDPLQAIFGFGQNKLVPWSQIKSEFPVLLRLSTPWRWSDTNPELGQWLTRARQSLIEAQTIRIDPNVVEWRLLNHRNRHTLPLETIHAIANGNPGRTVVICRWPNECHSVASKLKGRFDCIEPVEAPDLSTHARKLDGAFGYQIPVALIDFARICMTAVGSELKNVRDAFDREVEPRTRKFHSQVKSLLLAAHEPSGEQLHQALKSISAVPGCHIYRKELFEAMLSAMRLYNDESVPSLEEAVFQARDRTRRIGRKGRQLLIGRTLLVKGLEFDNAIVVDAEGFGPKDLYVAITRGAKSLTVLSSSQVILAK